MQTIVLLARPILGSQRTVIIITGEHNQKLNS